MTGIINNIFATKVPHNHCAMLERNGKFVKVLRSGPHWVHHFTGERLHNYGDWRDSQGRYQMNKEGRFLELTEQFWETAPIDCITKNEIHISLTAKVTFRILDPEKATYEVDVLPLHMLAAVEEAFRNCIVHHTIEELSDIRDDLSKEASQALMKRMNDWGVQINHVAIGDFAYPKAIAAELIEKKRLEKQKERQLVEASIAKEQASKADETARIVEEGRATRQAISAKAQAEKSRIEAEADAQRQAIATKAEAERAKVQAEGEAAVQKIASETAAAKRRIETQSIADAERTMAAARQQAYEMQTDAEIARVQQLSAILGKENAARMLTERNHSDALKEVLAGPANKLVFCNEEMKLKLTQTEPAA